MTCSSEKTRPVLQLTLNDQIPPSLQEWDHWLLWRYEWKQNRQQWAKMAKQVRYVPWGKGIEITTATSIDPYTWSSWEDVTHFQAVFETDEVLGIGFALTEPLEIVALDFDDCIDKATGVLDPEVEQVVRALDTYTEVSPSGKGLRCLLRGKKPGPRCQHRDNFRCEMYCTGRWVSLTGRKLPWSPADLQPRQQQLEDLYQRLFPPDPPKPVRKDWWQPTGSLSSILSLTFEDAEVLERARNASYGMYFDSLYRGLCTCGNRSEDDWHLASLLSFWTQDAHQIERLMRQSGLARHKYNRADYLPRTIQKVLAGRTMFYTGGRRYDAVAIMPPLDLSDLDGPPDPHADEDVAAGRIARARRDQRRYPCTSPHCVLLRDKVTNDRSVDSYRCEKWNRCPGCTNWLRDREHTNASLRFHSVPALWETWCTERQWPALLRAINRKDGEYLKIRDNGGWYVVLSVQVRNSSVISAQAALDTVWLLLGCYQGTKRPLSTSQNWKLPRSECGDCYAVVGRVDPSLTVARIREIAETVEATCRLHIPACEDGHTIRRVLIHREGWDEETGSHLDNQLFAGEVLPDTTDWEEEMPSVGRRAGNSDGS